jgi:hypothetical protein
VEQAQCSNSYWTAWVTRGRAVSSLDAIMDSIVLLAIIALYRAVGVADHWEQQSWLMLVANGAEVGAVLGGGCQRGCQRGQIETEAAPIRYVADFGA